MLFRSQRQDPLFLQIGLVNTGKALRDHDANVEEARRHRRMLAAATLTVILIADHDRTDAFRFVPTGNLRHGEPCFTRQDIRALARFGEKCIVRPQKHIVADLVQVAAELEPGTGRRNVIGRRLALSLDQEREVLEILAVPTRERLQ